MSKITKLFQNLFVGNTNQATKRTTLQLEAFEDRQVPALLTIGGSIYDDKNGNGIRDAGEIGLAGVPLELRNSQGVLVSTGTSGSDGSYKFDRYTTLPSQSLTQKFDTSINPTKANYTGVVMLPGFDSSLGTLDSVDLILTSTGTTVIKAENLEDNPETLTLQPRGTFRATVTGLSPVEVLTTPTATTLDLAASDGINDYSGTSGRTLAPISLGGTKTITFTTADALAQFIKTQVPLNLSSRVSVVSDTPGNVMVQANSMVGMTLSVVYRYRAVPPLDPGNYTVTETVQPPNYLDGLLTTNNVTPIPNSYGTNTINVSIGPNSQTQVNFGEVKPASVSGVVRLAADGITQMATFGIPGAIVNIVGTNDMGQAVSTSTTTASDGTFAFTGLRPGNYQITATAGKRIAVDSVSGSAGGVATPGQITQIKLDSGTIGTNYIFNMIVPSTLVGTAYQDSNTNGFYDASDLLLSNVSLTLTGTDYKGKAITLTTVTDSFGEYTFTNLLPGTYAVKATAPAGLLVGKVAAGSLGGTTTVDSVTNVKVGQDAYGDNYDFAFLNPARVTGFVYLDQNNDGARRSSASISSLAVDPGVAGVTVTITGMDVLSNSITRTTKTLADGSYDFSNMPPGTYKIVATPPTGYLEGKTSAGNAGSTSIRGSSISGLSLVAGQTASEYNFGLLKPTVISGIIANDLASNNRYDAGDPGIAGVIVTLTGTDSFGKAVFLQTVSNAAGKYSFGTISPGSYTIRMGAVPTGFTGPVVQNGSLGGTISGQTVSLAVNQGQAGSGYNFLLKSTNRSKRGFFN